MEEVPTFTVNEFWCDAMKIRSVNLKLH